MSKYSDVSKDIEDLVIEISNELGLAQMGVDFQPLCVPKAKEVCKVVKANELAEYASARENLVFVICYGDAFDAIGTTLTTSDEERKKVNQNKYLWIYSEMSKVKVDSESGKISIGCPTITLPVTVCEEFKGIAYEAALLGQYTISSIAQKKKEEAERKKAEKAAQKKHRK